TSAVQSGGVWNEADYANPKVDAAIKSYTGALSLKDQRKYARQIELQMLHDTPYIFPYFFKWTQAGSKRVKGFKADAIGTQYLGKPPLGWSARVPGRHGGPAPGTFRLPMARFLLKRFALALVTLFLLTVIVFAAAQLLPGNLGRNILGPFASRQEV